MRVSGVSPPAASFQDKPLMTFRKRFKRNFFNGKFSLQFNNLGETKIR